MGRLPETDRLQRARRKAAILSLSTGVYHYVTCAGLSSCLDNPRVSYRIRRTALEMVRPCDTFDALRTVQEQNYGGGIRDDE